MVKRLLWFIFLAVLLSAGIVNAQTQTPPLWVTTLDSLWLWSGKDAAPKMIVNQQANVTFSPDGTQVALTLWTDHGLDWAVDDFNVANEVWIADSMTGEMTKITGQPADSSEEQFVLYSQPSWSPDSTRLIWSQVAYPSNDEQVVIYDLASGTTTALLTGLKAGGDVPRAAVDWSETGIALDKNVFFSDGSKPDSETIFVYDETGKLLSRTILGDAHDGFSYGHVWISDGETEKIAVLYNDGSWLLIDPTTGKTEPMVVLPEIYSPLVDSGASLYFQLNADQKIELWSPNSASADHIATLDYLSQLFTSGTIAPNGRQIAYLAQGSASTWPDHSAITVGGGDYSDSILYVNWGPIRWRLRPG